MNLSKQITILLLPLTLLLSCQNADNPNQASDNNVFTQFLSGEDEFEADYQDILERDTLKAITIFSPTSYFLYRGQPMGYEYELVKRLADDIGVELEMIVADDMDEIFNLLLTGEGDIITYGLTVTGQRKEFVDFSLPLNFTHQVLVQRKPDNWRQMKLHNIEKELIRNPIRLIGKNIHVRKNSSYRERLENLQEEIGGEIGIEFLPGNVATDDIIRMVNAGEIEYTIANENIARINKAYYANIDINTTVGVMQQLAWSTRKSSPELRGVVNKWITEQRDDSEFYVIYNKYFKNQRSFAQRVKSDSYNEGGNNISPYDELLQNNADKIDWDWRLLASQMYQESQFSPDRKSWAGAIGLMQLMPKTAKSYGYKNLKDPKSNIEAGIAHLEYLDNYWTKHIADSTERVKFILASYNAGHDHVQDARRLAEKYDYDPNVWFDNVEECLLMKSEKRYINDEVVKFGYCRGTEPVKYVTEIFERYKLYQQFSSEDELIAAS
ncbi:MAG: transporter substrate-binding domain-containing protein [Cyclobacteriaceae bacterium]